MNLFNLKNNSLFLSCWYERSRPVQIICFTTMILCVSILAFLSVCVHESNPETRIKLILYVFVGIQAITLLLQGTLFAAYMSSRERTSGTLDVHRNSPEPVEAKIFGLTFGSTVLEWIFFFLLFALELPFALFTDISIRNILLWNLSLILSGIFFHTLAVTMTLSTSTHKRRFGPLGAVILIVFLTSALPKFIFLSTAGGTSTLVPHLFGLTIFDYLTPDTTNLFKGGFYTLTIPLILMQALAQIPLITLMVFGMKRIFRMPNSPVLSKTDILRFCGFIFFMITGLFMANYLNLLQILAENTTRPTIFLLSSEDYIRTEIYFFTYLYFGMSCFVSFLCAPSYFKRSKYIVLSKQGLSRRNPFDDGSTCLFTMMVYILITGLFFIPYLLVTQSSTFNTTACLVIFGSYGLAFAGFLEFFRLGRFRDNKIILTTTMLIWWIFIPWIFFVASEPQKNEVVLGSLISPLYGLSQAVNLVLDQNSVNMTIVFIPAFLAGFMWFLARIADEKIKRQVSRDPSFMKD
jgi:hypothetical protein